MKLFWGQKGVKSQWTGNTLQTGRGKTRGGAVFITGKSSFDIRDRFFIMNHVQMDGGGIYLLDCRHVTIQNCIFFMNFAKWGGALYLERCSDVKINGCIFFMNYAKRDGGAISLSGCEKICFCHNFFGLNIALRSGAHVDIHNSGQITGLENGISSIDK